MVQEADTRVHVKAAQHTSEGTFERLESFHWVIKGVFSDVSWGVRGQCDGDEERRDVWCTPALHARFKTYKNIPEYARFRLLLGH